MPGDPLEAVMRQLRAQYVQESDQRVAELRTALARAAAGAPDALDELRRRFHKLAGSGGSYGLEDVTELSRAAEYAAKHLVDAGIPPDGSAIAELDAHVEKIAAAFAAARTAG